MRTRVEIKVSMCRVMVYLMVQRAIRSPANIYVQEGQVAISFHLHRELNVLVHPEGQMTSVIYIKKLTEELKCSPVEHCFFKVLCEEAGDNRREW
jgi:hypothetical protein